MDLPKPKFGRSDMRQDLNGVIEYIRQQLGLATSTPVANALVKRDAAGRAQVAAPAVAADIARLDTVNAHAANPALHTTVQAFPAFTDFNTLTTQGVYHGQFTVALTNEPLAGGTNSRWLTLEVQVSGARIMQHLRYEFDWNRGRMFWRQRDTASVWGAWVEIWTATGPGATTVSRLGQISQSRSVQSNAWVTIPAAWTWTTLDTVTHQVTLASTCDLLILGTVLFANVPAGGMYFMLVVAAGVASVLRAAQAAASHEHTAIVTIHEFVPNVSAGTHTSLLQVQCPSGGQARAYQLSTIVIPKV